MATSGRGTRSRSSPRRRCGIDVVTAITIVAATPRVPLTTMFQAAHSPGSDRLSAEHVDARRRARRTAGARRRRGTAPRCTSRRASTAQRARRPSDGGGDHERRRGRRRPRTAPWAWRRRRTRTAPWPPACTAAPAGAAGPPRGRGGGGATRPRRPRAQARRRVGRSPGGDRRRTSHDERRRRGRTWRRRRRRRRARCEARSSSTPSHARSRRTGPSARAWSAAAGVDARVGGDLLEPVGVRSWRTGPRTRRGRRRRRCPTTTNGPRAELRRRGGHVSSPPGGDRRDRRRRPMPRAPYTRSGRMAMHGADRQRGDDALADADERRGRRPWRRPRSPSETAPLPPTAYSTTNARLASDGRSDTRRARRRARPTTPSSRATLAEHQEDAVAGERADERHVDDVEAERRQAAVGEHQRLHDEHDGDGQRRRRTGRRAPRRARRRAGGRSCRWRRGSSASGRRTRTRRPARRRGCRGRRASASTAAGRTPRRRRRRTPATSGRRAVDEPVRDVHADHVAPPCRDPATTLKANHSQFKPNCEPTRRSRSGDRRRIGRARRSSGSGRRWRSASRRAGSRSPARPALALSNTSRGTARWRPQTSHTRWRSSSHGGALVDRRAVGEVDVAYGADLLEQRQRAVHGGHVHVGDGVGQLVGGERAALAADGVDHGGAGPPDAVALGPQAAARSRRARRAGPGGPDGPSSRAATLRLRALDRVGAGGSRPPTA